MGTIARLRRRLGAAAVLLSTVLFLCGPAFAGVKLALVFGNGKYQSVPTLDNPANDAADLAQTLRGMGFEVIEKRDATRQEMTDAVQAFSERIRSADVALFFYAGHGLQMNGENYLIPVDAKIETPSDVRFKTINLGDIQQEMEGPGRANIMILDACRNNPFADRLKANGRALSERGLGRIDATGVGSLIVFSTQPNNVALDGAQRNSPFTSALLKHMATPGLEVRQMISKVRGDVLAATDQKQVPWDNSSLVGDVYLAGPPKDEKPAVAVAAATPVPTPAAQAVETPPVQRDAAPAPAAVANGPVAECEKLAAPAPPYATLAMIKAANLANKDLGHLEAVCEAAVNAEPGNARMHFLLGNLYTFQKRYPEAVRQMSIAADAGNPEAQSALGADIMNGFGVLIDKQRALDLFSKSAAAGSPLGMSNLGAMYAMGFGVKKDPAQALAWYEKAVDGGNSFALNQIAIMYFNGEGVDRDYQIAAQYYQQAADLDDGYALKSLAGMYEHGLLGPANPAKANELRLKAAQVDPSSLDPVQHFASAPPPAQQQAYRPRRVVHYYRPHTFFGVCLVYPC